MAYKYDPKYAELLFEHLSKGFSFASFGGDIGIVRSTLYEWVDIFPEFKEAKIKGEQAGLRVYENALLAKATGNDNMGVDLKLVDNSCLIFALKTRFHRVYGEKKASSEDDELVVNENQD